MKEKVILTAKEVGDTSFALDHAERILNLPTPPQVWSLNDPKYIFTNGKIILRPTDSKNNDPQK